LSAERTIVENGGRRLSTPIKKIIGSLFVLANQSAEGVNNWENTPSSLSELICRKSGNHRRRVAFSGTTAPDAEQGFDFSA
jgi:hypothetical protein